METPNEFAARLFTALEELVGQEGMYLRGGHYDLAVESRQRAEPLVQQLTRLADEPGLTNFRPRIDFVLKLSAGHAAFLQEKLVEFAGEIRRIDQARHRTTQVAPAYAGSPRLNPPRFQATG